MSTLLVGGLMGAGLAVLARRTMNFENDPASQEKIHKVEREIAQAKDKALLDFLN